MTDQAQTADAKADKAYQSFKEFYPFYLNEHVDRTNRTLHFIGTNIVVLIAIAAVYTANPWLLLAMPLAGYGFAWVGHFFFEKNRPATFKYPFYSLMGDWVMWFDIWTGRIGSRLRAAVEQFRS